MINTKTEFNKIIVFESSLVTPHIETGLDIALAYLDAKKDLFYSPIYLNLFRVEAFWNYGQTEYEEATNKIWLNTKRILPEAAKIVLGQAHTPKDFPITEDTEVKSLVYEDFQIGKYIHSTLCSALKSSCYDLRDELTLNLCGLYYIIGVQSYLSSKDALELSTPDLAIICNGRFITQAATLEACRTLKVDYLLHERGSDRDKYMLQKNIHDFVGLQKDIVNYSMGVHPATMCLMASNYYHGVRNKKERTWDIYNLKQKSGHIPEALKNKDFIAYFVSSDDEYESLNPEMLDSGFGKQKSALSQLVKLCEQENKFLCIRMHPRQADLASSDINFYYNLRSPNVLVIEPSSDYDSYTLIERSALVVTYGSTIGMEALFMRKPVIVLSKTIYDFSSEIMKPANQDELLRAICTPKEPQTNESAMIFGYYQHTHGYDHYYYRPTDMFSGEICGIKLGA